MISVELFITLGIAAGLFALYGLLDMRNRFYANIGALFMSSIMIFYMSTTVINGTLQTGVIINQTTGATTPLVMQDAGIGYILLIPALAAMLFTAYLIWDAYEEVQQNKRDAEEMI